MVLIEPTNGVSEFRVAFQRMARCYCISMQLCKVLCKVKGAKLLLDTPRSQVLHHFRPPLLAYADDLLQAHRMRISGRISGAVQATLFLKEAPKISRQL
jgi:hypothetical protein